MSRKQQHYCFNKNKIYTHQIEIIFNLKAGKSLFLLLGLENRNLFWYRDFLGRWEKLYHEK